ncbi:MAG TPA: plastocyanin/azurin family copper-binding protein [Candidatus Acidoferrales bacterium]|nr:plastocyanin/azurin family copper-binding protein [Candidatus Acidoferrales bacterium]
MKISQLRFSVVSVGLFALAIFALPPAANAQWRAKVGAQSKDMGKQALAFLPNEIWIHAGDSITWTFESDEIHTLTFLTVGQPLPAFQAGCPGFASSPAVFDGSACVTTPPMVTGQTFTVSFPKAGSFKFECLVHLVMSGTVHVLDLGQPLPHSQKFYDDQAAKQRTALLTDIDAKTKMEMSAGDDGETVNVFPRTAHVTAGVGEINATPAGYQTASKVRFINGTLTIHVGETVEWSNHDPLEPHTITFGFGNSDPADEFDPTPNVTIDADGALHAIISLPTDQVSSGFLAQPLEDEPGVPQNPVVNPNNPATNISNVAQSNPSRFRVTFMKPGVFNYKCVLHDNLGMVGKVIVQP